MEIKWLVDPVSALRVMLLVGVKGGADTTIELQGIHVMFDLRFNLCLLILVLVVLP